MNVTATLEKPKVSTELRRQETVIERGKQAFADIGRALTVIRDNRLYKSAGYSTFEIYCFERWGWQRAHAYRMIEAAQTVSEMSPIGDKMPTVETESQARELAKIKNPVLRSQVWQEVNQQAAQAETPVTASLIKTTVQKHVQIHSRDSLAPSREDDGMDIVRKINAIRQGLTESQKIFDPFLAACVREIKHNCTLTDEQREEIVLFSIEESHAHTVQEIAEDCKLVESEVKALVEILSQRETLASLSRLNIGGSARQTLIFSRRKPCSCV